MPDLGPAELLIVLAIVVLVFGGSKIGDMGGALGKSIREFRKAVAADDDPKPDAVPTPAAPAAIAEATVPADAIVCPSCHTANARGARFCAECGSALTA